MKSLVFVLIAILSAGLVNSMNYPRPARSGAAEAPPGAGPLKPADFNGDGFADLAIGIFAETLGSAGAGGAVAVLYGSASGVSSTDQLWTQDSTGIADTAEPNDFFGASVAAGDFNGDGLSDLAIGVSQERNPTDMCGAVHVLYGTPSGLSELNSDFFMGDSFNNNYGYSLAVGDFDGDGRDDLAVGDPHYDTAAASNAGGVGIHYGSATGLGVRRTTWHQDSVGILDTAEALDEYGRALTAGDFNNDGFADLAIGVPLEDFGLSNLGVVNVIYGTSGGLASANNQVWGGDTLWGISISGEAGEEFGFALSAGDFNNDGCDDLAVGTPLKNINTLADAGMVIVLRGSSARLTASGHQIWIQNNLGPSDYTQIEDHFGAVLIAGNFNGDAFADLAIGVPDESVGSVTSGGAVNLLFGSTSGLRESGAQFWSQDSAGIADAAEPYDRFGSALAYGDFNGDGFDDLAIGAPLEDIGSADDAGAIHVLYGGWMALSATGSQFWHQDSAGVLGGAELNDKFGASLASHANSRSWF